MIQNKSENPPSAPGIRRFSVKFFVFVLPVLALLVAIELFFRQMENPFKTKAEYFAANKSRIEVLFFGSSHTQNGVNPEFFAKPSCNLGFASQDIKADSSLFFHNVRQMPRLRTVIYELEYHRMDLENGPDYVRTPWYYLYYGIEIAPVNWINKISLYSSNTTFFNENLLQMAMGKEKVHKTINKYGYVTKNFSSEFGKMGYDSAAIAKSADKRLKGRFSETDDAVFARNARRVEMIAQYCKSHGIRLMLVGPPLYQTYQERMLPRKRSRVRHFIDTLREKYGLPYADFSADARFRLRDFADDDHLDPDGAKKYTQLLDSLTQR